MAVEVVAVGGVHVGAHPQARVGDAHPRRRRPLGEPGEHRRGLRRERGAARVRAAPAPAARARRATTRPAGGRGCRRSPRARGRRAPARDLRRTAARRPSRRAAGRGAARARRRAAPGDRHPPEPPATPRAARDGAAHPSPRRCRGAGRRRSACASTGATRGAASRAQDASPATTASRTCLGSMKRTSSLTTSTSEMSATPRSRKKSTSSPHEVLGRAGAGGDAHDALVRQPLLAHLARVVDQVRVGAAVARDLDQPHRVRRVARADHEHQIAAAGHLLDGRLAVGGGVADVVGAGTDDRREALASAARGSSSFHRPRASSA